ncbi:hypothetical protein [Hyphomicrobium sp. CS1BSMeth3]|uniref:hypothetical protein n=1 Tax=Hyphomicrobium sp. CS1BSMeth3 TaxID=1892844 RepID=UPI00116041B5|nr:hypothetical protein [Hyphomicrobium sp. CS1BSMeth3]
MKLPYIAALVGAVGISLGAAVFIAAGSTSGTTATATAATADVVTMSIRQRHTIADMIELSDGITYDDAARSLGVPGHLQTRNVAGMPGIENDPRVSVYAWPNPDGSRVILAFRNDRLIHRTHVGLH